MADITQRLGFDTSEGVQALRLLSRTVNNLNRALGRLNNAQLGNVNAQLTNLQRSLGVVPAQAQTAGRSLQAVGAGAGQQLQSANTQLVAAGQNLTTVSGNASTASRAIRSTVGAFTVLNSSIGGLRRVSDFLRDAADASEEFQTAIAEVLTIAGRTDTFDGLKQSVRELSQEFGRPTVEQTEAAYQAFSNQVIQSAADIEFLADANRLAIASASEVSESVNILSSVINSYGLEARDAGRVSDVLFKAVELGRFRIEQVADSFGSVTALATEAGISFNEVAASLATITRRGTTASVALTQIRGIAQKLVKPTEAMKEAFAEFGVSSGPAAIEAAGGLAPLLQKLQQFAEENNTTLPALFGRVRAGAGALNLAAENSETLNEILGELTDSAGAAENAFRRIEDTGAREPARSLNRLKVTVEELGDSVLPVIVSFTELFNEFVPDARTLGILVAGLSASLAAATLSAGLFAAALIPIAAILAPAVPAILAISAATGLAILAANELNTEIARQKDLALESSQAAVNAANTRVQETRDRIEELKSQERELTQEVEDQFEKQLAASRKFNASISSEFSTSIQSFVDLRSKAAAEIGKLAETAEKISTDAASRIREGTQQLDDIKFDRSIEGFNAAAQSIRQLDRAQQTATSSRQLLAEAGLNEEKNRLAIQERERAEQQLAAAERSAAASGNLALERRVQDAREQFIKDNIRADKRQIEETERLRADQAAKAEQRLRDQTQELENQLRKLLELGNPFDAAGFPKTAEQIKTDMEAMAKLSREIGQNLRTDVTGGLAEAAGFDFDAQADQVIESIGELLFDQQKIRGDLDEIIQSEPFQARVEVQAGIEREGVQLEADQASADIADLRKQLEAQLFDQALTVPVGIDESGFVAGAEIVAGKLLGLVADINSVSGAQAGFTQRIQETTQSIRDLDATGVESARETLDKISQTLQQQVDQGQVADDVARSVRNEIESARAILETQAQIIEAEQRAVNDEANELPRKVDEGRRSFDKMGNSVEGVNQSVGQIGPIASAQIGSINQVEAAWRRVEQAANDAARAGAGATAGGTAFFGKTIHRQSGGFTRGQDRILTSTAPGEFVINADAARQFRSELTAINAQQRPQFREQGGSTTNIGDVNVNVQTQDASAIQPREIARQLKRELRARTSSF